ncbi:MAG: zinc-ribbon and DUF3426 domain-containing protein [Granulosicoccus sp.]
MGNSADKHNFASSEPGVAQPQTRCPNCQTVFEVSPDLLVSDDTRVRCGECLSIFDALINLRRDIFARQEETAAVEREDSLVNADTFTSAEITSLPDDIESTATHVQDDASTLDVTYSDYDLFSGEAALPDVAYFDQTQDLDGLQFDEPDGDETFSDTLFAHDMTGESPEQDTKPAAQSPALDPDALDAKVDFVTDDVQSDPVVFVYRDPDETQSDSAAPDHDLDEAPLQAPDEIAPVSTETSVKSSSWIVRSLLATLIIVMVAGLYVYRSRDSLLQNPELRPWIAKTCSWMGCELAPLVDLAALKQLKRTVFAHPTNENELVIDLAFINEAEFDQPYPVLQIRLTNRNGALVVQNNVTPAEYLNDWQAQDLLAAGERIDLSLTFEDPGQTATYAELQFLQ